jgi:hypothetical protein
MSDNIFIQTIKTLFIDLVGEILYFPFWWYTKGLVKMSRYVWHSIKRLAHNLSLRVMLTHLFTPMFAQRDRAGRAISFFMRLIILITRGIVFLVIAVLYICLLIFWIFLPPLIIIQVANNLRVLWLP